MLEFARVYRAGKCMATLVILAEIHDRDVPTTLTEPALSPGPSARKAIFASKLAPTIPLVDALTGAAHCLLSRHP